jgi:hypothetical protein
MGTDLLSSSFVIVYSVGTSVQWMCYASLLTPFLASFTPVDVVTLPSII